MNDDLISRQAAIDLFPNDALEWDTKGGYVAPHLVRRMIEELPSAQPTVDAIPQWIPCSERLPSSEEDVLCDDEGRVTIGYYTDEEIGWHDMHSYRVYPNAWMPLPIPYERKEE